MRPLTPLAIAILIPLVVASQCCALEKRLESKYPKEVDGDVLWVPSGHEGSKKIVVWRKPTGELMVYADPARTYQDATDYGISENRLFTVITRYVEVTKNPLDSPRTVFGWRNPWNRMKYPNRIFKEQQGKEGLLEIFTNGNGGYMIVITLIEDSSLKVWPPRVREEASNQDG